MDRKHYNDFKKPKSSLGRRSQRLSITGHNESSRLATISESHATPSTSQNPAEESFTLGYDSLCDQTLRTPLSHKFASGDSFRTPKYTPQLQIPSSVTGSNKKHIRRLLSKPEPAPLKSAKSQTGRDIDTMATPPFVLRKRLQTASSAFHDLEEEYEQLKEFTTLEKQVLTNEAFADLKAENIKLKQQLDSLEAKIEAAEEKSSIPSADNDLIDFNEMKMENVILKQQLDCLVAKNIALEKNAMTQLAEQEQIDIKELQAENLILKQQLDSLEAKSNSLEENASTHFVEQKLKDLEKENDELKLKCNELTFKLANEKTEDSKNKPEESNFEDLLKENAELKNKCTELTVDFNKLKEELSKMSSENISIIKKCELANNKLIDYETVNDAKEAKWNIREKELIKSLQEAWNLLSESGLRNNLDSTGKLVIVNSELETPVAAKGDINESLVKSLKEATNIINILQEKITVLQTSFHTSISNKNDLIASLSDKVKCFSQQFTCWSEKLKSLEDLMASNENDFTNLKKQMDSIKMNASLQISRLRDCLKDNTYCDVTFIDDLIVLDNKMASEEITVDNILEDFSSKILFLLEENVSMKNKVDSSENNWQAVIKSKNEEIDKYSVELKEKSNKIETYLTELKEKGLKEVGLEEGLKENQNKIKNLEEVVKQQHFMVDELTCNLAEKDTELEELKLSHCQMEDKIKSMSDLLKSNADEIEEHSFTIKEKESKLIELTRELNEKLEKEHELISSLSVKNEEFNYISIRNDEKEMKIKELCSLLTEKENRISTISCELSNEKSRSEQLTSTLELKSTNFDEISSELYENKMKLEELLCKLQDKDSSLKECVAALQLKDLTIEEYSKSLHEKDLQIDALNADVFHHVNIDEKLKKQESDFSELLNKNEFLNNQLINVIDQLEFLKRINLEKEVKVTKIKNELEQTCSLLENVASVLNTSERAWIEEKKKQDDSIECLSDQLKYMSQLIEDKEQDIRNLKVRLNKLADQKSNEIEKLYSFASTIGNPPEVLGTFDNILHLIETKFNDLHSTNNLLSLQVQHFEISHNEMQSDKLELQQKLNHLETSYSDILAKSLDDINRVKFTKDSQISCLETVINNLKTQLESKDNEMDSKDKELAILKNEISCFNRDRNEFFIKLVNIDCAIKSDDRSVNSFDDLAGYIKNKFVLYNDLIEHLRNQILSKKQQISQIMEEINIASASMLEERNKIISLEDCIISLKSKLEYDECKFRDILVCFNNVISEYCTDCQECKTFEDVVEMLKNQFSNWIDLNDHLRNIVRSKDDQIARILENHSQKYDREMEISCVEKSVLDYSDMRSYGERETLVVDEVVSLEKKILLPDDQVVLSSSKFDLFMEKLKSLLDDVSVETDEDALELIRKKFSDFEVFKEHLKNSVQSKDEQIHKLVNTLKQLKNVWNSEKREIERIVLSTKDELSSKNSIIENYKKSEMSKTNELSYLGLKIDDLENVVKIKHEECALLKDGLEKVMKNYDEMHLNMNDRIERQLQQLSSNVDDVLARSLPQHEVEIDLMKTDEQLKSYFEGKNWFDDDYITKIITNLENECRRANKAEEELFITNFNLNVIKDELMKALSILEQYETQVDTIEKQNVAAEERNSFFSELEETLSKCGTNIGEICSFDRAIDVINQKINEFDDLKNHFKNVIQAKDEKLSKYKDQVVTMRNYKNETDDESNSIGETNDCNSIISSYPVHFCNDLIEKLAKLASSLFRTSITVDGFNYCEEIVRDINARCSVFSELFSYATYILNSHYDPISKLVNDSLAELKSAQLEFSSELESCESKLLKVNCGPYDSCDKLIEDRDSFFSKINEYISTIDSKASTVNSYDHLFECLKKKFSDLNDLKNHFQNIIKSSDDLIENISKMRNIVNDEAESVKLHHEELKLELMGSSLGISTRGYTRDFWASTNKDLNKIVELLKCEVSEYIQSRVETAKEKFKLKDHDNDHLIEINLLLNNKLEMFSTEFWRFKQVREKNTLKLEEKIAFLENEILSRKSAEISQSELQEEISKLKSIKDNERRNAELKFDQLKLKYNALVENDNESISRKLAMTEKRLSEVLEELDSFKLNDVVTENTIKELREQVDNLNLSLSIKKKEIDCSKMNMDNLSEIIVTLTKDKEYFLNKMSLIDNSFSKIQDFDDILSVVDIRLREVVDLKEKIKNIEESTDDTINKLKSQLESNESNEDCRQELLDLREQFDNVCKLLTESKTNHSDLNEIEQCLCDVLKTCEMSVQEEEEEENNFITRIVRKIHRITDHILNLNLKIQSLNDNLEIQISSNTSNIDFISSMNAAFTVHIESTNKSMCDLLSEISFFKEHFDKKINDKDLEIDELQKEIGLTMDGFKEFISLGEKQNEYTSSLVDACLKVKMENQSIVNDCYLTLKNFCDSDIEVNMELVEVTEDLICFVRSLQYEKISLDVEKLFLKSDDQMNSINKLYSNEINSLLDSMSEIVNVLRSDVNCIEDSKLTDQVKSSLEMLQEPLEFSELVPTMNYSESSLSDCMEMIELIDSISVEGKLISTVYSAVHNIYNNLTDVSFQNGDLSTSKGDVTVISKKAGQPPDISLFMSVEDQSCLDMSRNLDSFSEDKNNSLLNETTSFCEKTLYILPGHMSTTDMPLEETLYLSHRDQCSSVIDPLKPGDKTLASSCDAGWLTSNFKRKVNDSCMEDSINEFHDVHDSVDDPLGSSRSSPDSHLINKLKHLLGVPNMSDSDLIAELESLIHAVHSIKTEIKVKHPELLENSIDIIFKMLSGKLSSLKESENSLSEKNRSLLSSLESIQNSLNIFKNLHQMTSSEIEQSKKQIECNMSLLFKAFENCLKNISERGSDSLKKNYEELTVLYTDCLNELQTVKDSKSILKNELDICKIKSEKLNLKNIEISEEKDKLDCELRDLQVSCQRFKSEGEHFKVQLKSLESQNLTLASEISDLKSNVTSLEMIISSNSSALNSLNSDKASLLAEVASLKDKLSLSNSNVESTSDKKTSKLESTYDLLRKNYDDLFDQYLISQRKIESMELKVSEFNSIEINNVVEELRQVLRILDCDDEFDLKNGLSPIFAKIRKRLSLLKEYHAVKSASSFDSDVSDLQKKIKSLESDMSEVNNFKLSFAKELHSLKPDIRLDDLLKLPLVELYSLMIKEIMSRESVIISNLKDDYDRKISSLKEQLHQFEEKDKRRVQWVSEIENDNDNLNAQSTKLKQDVHCLNNKLEIKQLFEKLIFNELINLEKRLSSEDVEITNMEQYDADVIQKSEKSGDILFKLQKIIKNCTTSEEFTPSLVHNYKESIKTLEDKCFTLESKIDLLEKDKQDFNQENEHLKFLMNEKIEFYNKEMEKLNNDFEVTLADKSMKLKMAEEMAFREQDMRHKEKEFTLKTEKENKDFKEQLEKHLDNLNRMGTELCEAKKAMKCMISKHEDEISNLMKVKIDLESQLKLSHSSDEEKNQRLIRDESELQLTKKNLSDLKLEYSSTIIGLQTENKTLKNEINCKEKEIAVLHEEYQREIINLKSNLDDNLISSLNLQTANEDFKTKVAKLESELFEREAAYRDSISNIMIERENDIVKIKTLEDIAVTERNIANELKNKLAELNNMYQSLKVEKASLVQKLNSLECLNKELVLKASNAETALTEVGEKHCREIIIANEKISNYIREIEHLNKSIDSSKLANNRFNFELLKLFPEFSNCTEDLLDYIKSKLEELDNLKEELEEKKNECVYLEEDCDDLAGKLKMLEKRIGDICREQFEDENKYKNQLSEKSITIEQLENKNHEQSSKIIKVTEELKYKSKMLDELKLSVKDLENKFSEAQSQVLKLTKENEIFKNQKQSSCEECKQLMEQIVHFKAKVLTKDVKIAELTAKAEVAASPLKERSSLLEKYKEKVSELEGENSRLKSLGRSDLSGSTLKDISNSDSQMQTIAKLEARIIKLEKDREFLKRLCEKRASVILSLKEKQESNR